MSANGQNSGKSARKTKSVKSVKLVEEPPKSPPQEEFESDSGDEVPVQIPDEKVPNARNGVGKFLEPIKIEIEEIFTYGVTSGKYGGYSFPIVFEGGDERLELIREVALRNGAEIKFYGDSGNSLYLQCDKLSPEQTEGLVGKGIMIIAVALEITKSCIGKNGSVSLGLSLKRLSKVRVAEKMLQDAPLAF